ncbi:MAG TPA: hypothetical protein VFR90_10520 [Methylibium sp.]|uniref:hypothetical protein n=1 Tax=Methylibium sp. TaxID=2067992 RepID=UPI002DBD3D80|nr:hypothetical protein [Methylibium sp.]HEU4459546.1 hypothetical protein [Methylibium sp.]
MQLLTVAQNSPWFRQARDNGGSSVGAEDRVRLSGRSFKLQSMVFPRPFRRFLARFLAATMLLVQLAAVSYACPLQRQDSGGNPMAGMPCAEMMSGVQAVDAEQPGLCFKHCQIDPAHPPLDQSPVAAMALPALLTVIVLPAVEPLGTQHGRWASHQIRRDRAPPDDHSIVHCCWRI